MTPKDKNTIVIGLACFCSKCTTEIRPATCEDMNGDTAVCKNCAQATKMQIGISVHADSMELLRHTYEQMQKHHHLIKKLLSERNPRG